MDTNGSYVPFSAAELCILSVGFAGNSWQRRENSKLQFSTATSAVIFQKQTLKSSTSVSPKCPQQSLKTTGSSVNFGS